MVELYDEFFSMLRFAKRLCECDMENQLKEWFGACELDADNYDSADATTADCLVVALKNLMNATLS